jgi:hypothetical protein
MSDLIKLDTSIPSIVGGAAAGAAAGHFLGHGWKNGAILGAIVAVVLPTGAALYNKAMPAK